METVAPPEAVYDRRIIFRAPGFRDLRKNFNAYERIALRYGLKPLRMDRIEKTEMILIVYGGFSALYPLCSQICHENPVNLREALKLDKEIISIINNIFDVKNSRFLNDLTKGVAEELENHITNLEKLAELYMMTEELPKPRVISPAQKVINILGSNLLS